MKIFRNSPKGKLKIPEKAGIYMLLDKFGKDVNHGWNKTDNLKYRIHEEHYSRKFSFIRIIIYIKMSTNLLLSF